MLVKQRDNRTCWFLHDSNPFSESGMAWTGGIVLCCREEPLDGDSEVPYPLHNYNVLHLLGRDILFCFLSEVLVTNGARELQIQNWFQESVAGRQLDFQQRRPLDAPSPLGCTVAAVSAQHPVEILKKS